MAGAIALLNRPETVMCADDTQPKTPPAPEDADASAKRERHPWTQGRARARGGNDRRPKAGRPAAKRRPPFVL